MRMNRNVLVSTGIIAGLSFAIGGIAIGLKWADGDAHALMNGINPTATRSASPNNWGSVLEGVVTLPSASESPSALASPSASPSESASASPSASTTATESAASPSAGSSHAAHSPSPSPETSTAEAAGPCTVDTSGNVTCTTPVQPYSKIGPEDTNTPYGNPLTHFSLINGDCMNWGTYDEYGVNVSGNSNVVWVYSSDTGTFPPARTGTCS